MNISKSIVVGIFAVASLSCTNDSESDLIDNNTDEVTYNGTVKTIITQNCINCHSQPPQNDAPMSLITYDDVKNAVLTRGLIARISSNDPAFWMPRDGQRLPQSQINQIIAWKDANFPE
ncbi:hypothetical protein FEDK69T_17440 [Flavobacterium enshiense DK69]|uniref:Cytochrome c domain-containing protein n=1 Tax=Flavobacterium enshiense DK69 TaxID=1107311 RepID=V6S870_9FLAO|nr:hypothetical protein [Flavobacterium enshiense]ESU22841.1 hypothetical protein FEDK69T_17440 [Flavobacterium enshiense DK69]KGO93978.1 hypothetical protein Q767_13615 [Flavobacterium enshiense DK69]